MVVVLFYTLLHFAYHAVEVKSTLRDSVLNSMFIEKTTYITDDVANDVRNILKVDLPANSPQVIFTESVSLNRSRFFSTYRSFIMNYSSVVGQNISFSYSDPLNITLSDGMFYRTNFFGNRTDFSRSGAAPSVNRYDVILSSNQTSSGVTNNLNFVANGTYITVNYTDPINPNKNVYQAGYINPNALSSLNIKFGAGQSILLYFGLINSVSNSYSVEQRNILTMTNHILTVNRTTKSGLFAHYNLLINVTNGDNSFIGNLSAN